MIEFNFKEVHRDKLYKELINAGIDLQPTSPIYCFLLNKDGKIWIDTNDENRALVQHVLDAHDPILDDSDKKEELLQRLGITQEDATLLLS